jgi:uncharacterized phage protein (TIGR02218 family)
VSTFPDFEESAEGSEPIETYAFAVGSDAFNYTSADENLTIGVTLYQAETISHSAITEGGDRRNRTVTVKLPTTNSLAASFIEIPPGQTATVSIFRYQEDVLTPAQQVLVFKGVLENVRYVGEGQEAELIFKTIEAAVAGNMPRRTFTTTCNHLLYSPGCGVDPSTHVHDGNVSAVVGSVITVDGLNASGIDATGGYAQPDGVTDFRLVIAQSGDDITVLLPFASDPTGTTLRVFRGCDHLIDGDCAQVFDNVLNFDGFPYVPNRNVFERGLESN